MNPVQRNQPPYEPPPSYEDVMAEDALLGNHTVQSTSANATGNLKYQTCKAILDGNYDKALKTISDRIKQGEKISSLSDNLEGRALQGDWEMAKSLARQRLELGHT
ncbi:hypothetical protein [Endozoicomonas sp. ONNA2]|uniref:hypothetical protein n=1 Tax=Endozoicomonas sp. ONNA2 TaxID=2828741 RepID=UPI002147FD02|nr:hypothetical protein [Endozoicomonas sp. ONNA2]